MHLGLTPWNLRESDAATLTAQASRAESLGYESFWLPESHFTPNAIPDPLMLLAAVAAATRHITLATTSYLLPLRNPLQAAEQVAVLDQLSNGRVLLGVGRGYSRDTLRSFGIDPGEKRELFEWSLARMREAWTGVSEAEPTSVDTNAMPKQVEPVPVQAPYPPIWVAAFGPKALAQAGRLGLPYLASPIDTFASLKDNFGIYDEACEAAGHGRTLIRPIMRAIFVSDDKAQCDAARQCLASAKLPRGLELAPELDDWAVIGSREAVRARLDEYENALGMTHVVATHIRMESLPEKALEDSVAAFASLYRG